MEVKKDDIVSVRHYSGRKMFTGAVTDVTYDVVTVKLMEEAVLLNASEGDPIVLGYESEKEIYNASCSLQSLDKQTSTIVLRIENVDVIQNKRLSERIPVSFMANIKIGESSVTHPAIVKNMSLTGMLICSKADFPLYQKLKFSINIGVIVNLQAIIVRKAKDDFNYEYGIKLIYTDITTPALLKRYILLVKKEQQEFIKKLHTSEASNA